MKNAAGDVTAAPLVCLPSAYQPCSLPDSTMVTVLIARKSRGNAAGATLRRNTLMLPRRDPMSYPPPASTDPIRRSVSRFVKRRAHRSSACSSADHGLSGCELPAGGSCASRHAHSCKARVVSLPSCAGSAASPGRIWAPVSRWTNTCRESRRMPRRLARVSGLELPGRCLVHVGFHKVGVDRLPLGQECCSHGGMVTVEGRRSSSPW
jgi:hypothetical protein